MLVKTAGPTPYPTPMIQTVSVNQDTLLLEISAFLTALVSPSLLPMVPAPAQGGKFSRIINASCQLAAHPDQPSAKPAIHVCAIIGMKTSLVEVVRPVETTAYGIKINVSATLGSS